MTNANDVPNDSFAKQHFKPDLGFRIVPRWFRATPFWQAREASHRAVIDQLYQMMASERVVQHGTGITCERGQWAISVKALSEASGASIKGTRVALDHLLKAGVIGQKVLAVRLPGRTLHLSIFTWLEYDTYDAVPSSTGKPLGKPLGKSQGKPGGKVRHEYKTPISDTSTKTPIEEIAASGPGDPPARTPAPASLSQAEEVTSDEIPPASESIQAKRLDENLIRLISSDLSGLQLATYLLFGSGAVGRPADELSAMRPTQAHWAPVSRNTEVPEANSSVTALAGYVAYRLAGAMVANGETSIRILNIGRLCGVVKNFLRTQTQDDLVRFVDCLSSNWQAIRASLGWMTSPPAIDELLLTNRHVMEQIRRLLTGQPLVTAQPQAAKNTGMTPAALNDFQKQLEARMNNQQLL